MLELAKEIDVSNKKLSYQEQTCKYHFSNQNLSTRRKL